MVFLLGAAALALWLAVRAADERAWQRYPLVVVAREGVVLRRGDGWVFPPRYETPLPRGVEARLLFERGEWLQIELSGGEVGWTLKENVVVDTP
ncbi:MAG TPA: hypothetical protein VFX03_06820 [Thermomicrobiales bacterium]|nr:hypothetical protein [Thermomicrobiales bacterium]